MEIPPAKNGRPSKYKKRYCKDLIDWMSRGKSIAGFCAHIKVSRPTIYEWRANHVEFSIAYGIAKEACQDWWENLLRAHATGVHAEKMPKSSESAIRFQLARRFKDYQPTQKIEGNVDNKVTVYEATISDGQIHTEKREEDEDVEETDSIIQSE